MGVLKICGVKALAFSLALALLPAAVPANVPLVGISEAQAEPRGRHWRGDRHWRGNRHWRGGRHWRGDRHWHRRSRGNGGAAIAGAIIGLGIGAAIASQPRYYYDQPRVIYRSAPVYYGRPAPWTGEWYRYCANRYRSFDPASGTFQPYHGPRRFCR